MASSGPTPLRKLLGERISELLAEADGVCEAHAALRTAEACGRTRRETASQLNQAVRRLRRAADLEELQATLLEAAGAFATGVALFRVNGGTVCGERVRGVPDAALESFQGFEISLAEAAALSGAIETQDPVVTATEPAAISPALAELLNHPPDGRASVFPISVRKSVEYLIYAWGTVEASQLELLAQTVAAVWENLTPPQAAAGLISISPAAGPAQPEPPARSAWDSLSAEEQKLHLRAQRFARVKVAEMRLHHAAEVQSGRDRRALYDALRRPIDSARETMREMYFAPCPSMVDYLHLELLRTLAHEDPEVFGEDYPGPVV